MQKEITPGTIVYVYDSVDITDSKFAIVIPYDFWKTIAGKATKDSLTHHKKISFRPTEEEYLTFLEMTTGFEMRANFSSYRYIVPHFSIFDPMDSLNKSVPQFNCFTHRDGSRYYKKFIDEIFLIMSFMDKRRTFKEYPQFSYMKDTVKSLEAWRRERAKEEVSSSST